MAKIRVLIVDDSVVIRKILTDVLKDDPDIEVAGIAANGKIALQKITQVNPDILTMDVEMPEMNGIETMAELRKKYPLLPVIMFSTLTQRGAEATLDALTAGANDYVTKPANVGSVTTAIDRIRAELVPKIKALVPRANASSQAAPVSRANAPGQATPAPTAPASPTFAGARIRAADTLPSATGARIDIVAIGVSTGGPNALAELMPTIPRGFPVPIVIVQHMPPMFTQTLAERLDSKCPITVREAKDGDILAEGGAWIAPGGFHMALTRRKTDVVVQLHQGPPENSCRPAVDVLFRSVAEQYGAHAAGVVLTGMGQDGLRGCERIRDDQGTVFVQDERSSVVWGMPGYVAQAGLAHKILPLDQIGIELKRLVARGRPPQAAATARP